MSTFMGITSDGNGWIDQQGLETTINMLQCRIDGLQEVIAGDEFAELPTEVQARTRQLLAKAQQSERNLLDQVIELKALIRTAYPA